MGKFKPINVVVHMPKDIEAFEKVYIEALFSAITQLAEKKKKSI